MHKEAGNTMYSLIIVDDDELIRKGLEKVIEPLAK